MVLLAQHHAHAPAHAHEAGEHRAGRPLAVAVPRHDDRPRQERGRDARLLDELGIAEDTIVMYSTDNGPHMNTWPDGAMTPFRSEKNTNWEGAFRVPLVVRWPGKIPAGAVSNEIVSHHDWLPTFLAAAGEPHIKEKLLKGHAGGGKTFKVHLDGYNLLPVPDRQGEEEPAPGLHLLQRRRRPGRAALRQLEDGVHGAALRGARCRSGPSRSSPLRRPQAVQPAHRPVRARRHHVEHLLGLVHEQGLHDHGGAEPGRGSSWRRSRTSRRARRRRASPSTRRWRSWKAP